MWTLRGWTKLDIVVGDARIQGGCDWGHGRDWGSYLSHAGHWEERGAVLLSQVLWQEVSVCRWKGRHGRSTLLTTATTLVPRVAIAPSSWCR